MRFDIRYTECGGVFLNFIYHSIYSLGIVLQLDLTELQLYCRVKGICNCNIELTWSTVCIVTYCCITFPSVNTILYTYRDFLVQCQDCVYIEFHKDTQIFFFFFFWTTLNFCKKIVIVGNKHGLNSSLSTFFF